MTSTNDSSSVRARRKEGLKITVLDDEVLVYDPDARRATCLNSFAAKVLDLCDGERSPSDIGRELPFDDVDEGIVWLTLTDLRKAQLLRDVEITLPGAYGSVSRRELVKRIGVGAAVAVPLVTSIPVPAAAQAATCLPAGSPCPTGSQGKSVCCPGLNCTGSAGFKTCQ